MTQTILPPVQPADPPTDIQLRALAKRYRGARGPAMQAIQLLGGQAESILERLPAPVRNQISVSTYQALELSFQAAARTRGTLPDTGPISSRLATVASGAAGGFGGLPSAIVELPITTTILFRSIQDIAASYGFDPTHEDTRADCLQVFASAGPLAEDDGTDLSFLSMRMGLTGASVQTLLKQIAPRLAAVLGQKLAAQTVPVLGAATGAAINLSFTRYYQEVAHVHFGLRKLAEDTGLDRAKLIEDFRNVAK